jgi:hypothetical protein
MPSITAAGITAIIMHGKNTQRFLSTIRITIIYAIKTLINNQIDPSCDLFERAGLHLVFPYILPIIAAAESPMPKNMMPA